jgi:Asp-tRNA(Asn)/Glu-tRNA(Gln) amidotransferase C subunit
MAMKKTGSPTKLTVFTGEEVNVLENHFTKTGKRAVSAFSEEELSDLQKELDAVNKKEDDVVEVDAEPVEE